MMPPHTIVPATEADITTIVNMLYLEKISLPLNQLMWKQWPNETPQKARIESAVSGSLKDASHRTYKFLDGENGEVVGLLVLARSGPTILDEQSEKPEDETPKPSIPSELRGDVFEMVVAGINDICKDSTTKDRIEIISVIIDQNVRGQGLGSKLMQKAFESARADGVPLMVSAEPKSFAFFEKLGFKSLKHIDMNLASYAAPNSGFGTFTMTRMSWEP